MVLSGSQILEYHPRWNGSNFSENSRKRFLFEILSCRTKSHLKNWQDPPEAPVRRYSLKQMFLKILQYLWWSLFLNKVAGLKETPTHVFL